MSAAIQYQGFLCTDIQVSKSRGLTPDGGCWVVIPLVKNYPKGFKVEPPKAGEKLDVKAELPEPPVGGEFAIDLPEQPTVLEFAGKLRLIQGGVTRELGDWFVLDVEEILREAEDKPDAERKSALKVHITDVRRFWGWGPIRDSTKPGIVQRHSFNRLRPDGSYSRDSVDEETGEPLTVRATLERFLVGALQGAPALERLPERDAGEWEQAIDVDFAPHELASVGIARFVKQYQTADPCPTWSGGLSFYDDDEGKVGYSSTGGPENTEDIPPEYFLSRGLRGTSNRKTLGYPPPYCMVRGGKTIATASVDRWEPALLINGRFWPLNDDTLLKLTKRPEFNVEFLSRWILATDEHRRLALLPDNVSRLLSDQSWTVYTLPLREIEVAGTGEPLGPELPAGDPPTVPAAPLDPLSIFAPEPTHTEPGPYAHMLPIRPQGKVVNGKRAPVEVEAYGFSAKHHTWRDNAANERLAVAQRVFAIADEGLRVISGGVNPLNRSVENGVLQEATRRIGGGRSKFERADLDLVWVITQAEGVDPDQVLGYASLIRRIEAAKEESPNPLLDEYEKAYVEVLKAKDETAAFGDGRFPPKQEILYRIAKEIVVLEKELNDQRSVVNLDLSNVTVRARDPRNKPFLDRLVFRVDKLIEEAARDRAERQAQAAAGGGSTLSRQQTLIVVNEGRSVDTRARVLDSEAGAVKLSRRAGWIENPILRRAELGPVRGISNQQFGETRFVPQPVRVTFGTTLRVRVDSSYGSEPFVRPLPAPPTGVDRSLQASVSPDVVPTAKDAGETYYVRHYKRNPSGIPTQVTPANSGIGPVIHRTELVLLLGLQGESNAGQLDEIAEKAARNAFRKKDEIEGMSVVLAGPWLVNPDGKVARTQIVSSKGKQGGLTGFLTNVSVGGRDYLNSLPSSSRAKVRPRAKEEPESAVREGLTK